MPQKKVKDGSFGSRGLLVGAYVGLGVIVGSSVVGT